MCTILAELCSVMHGNHAHGTSCQLARDWVLQVVGHTIQEQGINSACGEKVFRIDVGLSKGCGNGEPEVDIHSWC